MSKSQGQYRIFVVDDEPVIASSLGEILRRQGFNVSVFTDPLKALEAIHAKAPDFLITDVVMPGMSGIELAIVIKETSPSCTVLLFSGQLATAQLLDAARDRGHSFDVLTKPASPTEILGRISRALGLDTGPDEQAGKVH